MNSPENQESAGYSSKFRKLLTGEGLRSKLVRDGIGSMIFKMLYVLLSFFMGVLLARTLGAKGYGVYGYILAIISTLTIPAEFGLPTLVLRETAKNIAQSNWSLVKGVWRWATIVIAVLTIILSVGSLATSSLWAKNLSPEHVKTFYWGLLLIPLIALGQLRGAQLRGLKKVLLGNLPEQLLVPAFLILLIPITSRIFSISITPVVAMILNVTAAAAAFIIGAILLVKNTPQDVSHSQPEMEGKKWIKSAVPLAGINGLNLFSKQVSILILGLFVSSAEIGIYKVAIQFSILSTIGFQVVNMVIAPQLASMYAKNQLNRMQKLITTSSQAIVIINLIITIAIIVAGKPFIRFAYGQEFDGAFIPLTILLIGQFFNSVTGSVSAILNMTGKEKFTIMGVGIATLVNIPLNLLLSPKYGSSGAAIGTAASLIILNIFLWRVVKKELGFNSLPINLERRKPLN